MRRSRLCRLAVVSTAALAVMLSACAQSQHSYRAQSYAGAGPMRGQIAAAPIPRMTMEDDGMPAQHPPRLRRGAVPDDPSEPFSPNYGPPIQTTPAQKSSPEAHATYKRRTPIDADLIIARAITEHEMRTR